MQVLITMRAENLTNRWATNLFNIGRVAIYALGAFCVIAVVGNAYAGRQEREFAQQKTSDVASPQGLVSPTPTPTPTPTPIPAATPIEQIDAEATLAGPHGGQAQFFIIDIENEHATNQFLEGEFGYSDHRSHVTFETGKIITCTINGNQGAFTGMATIGGKHKQKVDFTVTVTANQTPGNNDTFSIVLSNGYSASGSLTSGSIQIAAQDPQGDNGGRSP